MQFGGQAHTGDGHLGVVSIGLVAKDLSDLEGPSVDGKRASVPGSLSKGVGSIVLMECTS